MFGLDAELGDKALNVTAVGAQSLGTHKGFSDPVNVRFSPKTASRIVEITGNCIRWHMPLAVFPVYEKKSFEYQKHLGFSSVCIPPNTKIAGC